METQPAYLSATKLCGSGGMAIILALTVSLLAGCAQPAAFTMGPFAQVNRIDTELQRGMSTKSDVERILGKPNGMGRTLMPPTQTKPGDVWVYYNSQTGTPRTSGGGRIRVEIDSRDQMIMVFFDGDKNKNRKQGQANLIDLFGRRSFLKASHSVSTTPRSSGALANFSVSFPTLCSTPPALGATPWPVLDW